MKLWTLVILALLEPAVIVGCGGEAGDPSEEPESATEAEPMEPELNSWCCELSDGQVLCASGGWGEALKSLKSDHRCWEQ